MKRIIIGCCLYSLSATLQATDVWQFSDRIAVTGAAVDGVFHHLEGAGRKHIATSANNVAVAWEDDRSGDPQVYLAIKNQAERQFTGEHMVSNGAEAYEPSVAATSDDRFIVAWEQDGLVYARSLSARTAAKPLQLSANPSSHASVVAGHGQIYCVWREQRDRLWNLVVARLGIDASGNLSLLGSQRVEKEGSTTAILYPSISLNHSGINLAWEDRQAGHTRLKHSFSADKGQSFSTPQYLNEFQSNRNQYDKGSGVTRVSLAGYGEDEVVAAWMDKRRGNTGYGIYAAFGSGDSYGPNEKVHGEKGDAQPHYNPATAGSADGSFVVAWDDFREGNSDIWISSYNDDGEWSDDFAPAPASAAGEQTHASVTLDAEGRLHLVWIERQSPDAPTRLWYSIGRRN